jgi:predicted metal-dependent hydrolase
MDFKYTIKDCPRSHSIRLSINHEGRVLATKPKRVPVFLVEEFIKKKQAWIEACLKKMAEKQESAKPLPTRQDFIANRYQFQKLIRQKLEKINSFYNFKYGLVTVKNAKTRLGSCSRRGALNFSYQLSRFDDEVIDYVVAHELCHLKEFNHSRKFWDLVALTIPNYREIRKKIKIF